MEVKRLCGCKATLLPYPSYIPSVLLQYPLVRHEYRRATTEAYSNVIGSFSQVYLQNCAKMALVYRMSATVMC